jgi:hypothetical protein
MCTAFRLSAVTKVATSPRFPHRTLCIHTQVAGFPAQALVPHSTPAPLKQPPTAVKPPPRSAVMHLRLSFLAFLAALYLTNATTMSGSACYCSSKEIGG